MFKNNLDIVTSLKKKDYHNINTIAYQKSKEELMSLMQVSIPYTTKNWKFWSPEELLIKISAGVFDNKQIISGKVETIEQNGNLIECGIADGGWRFKLPYSGEDYEDDIKVVLKNLIKQIGLKPILRGIKSENISRSDIWSSSGSDSTTVSESGCVQSNGTCNCGHKEGVKARKAWVNKCPHCGKSALSFVTSGDNPEGRITCGDGVGNGGCDADYCSVCGYENISGSSYKITECSEITKENPSPKQEGTFKIESSSAATSKSTESTGSTDTSSEDSSQMDEVKSYEDELKQICEPRDYHIILTPNDECIITTPTPPAKAEFEVKNWMVKYNTFKFKAEFHEESSEILIPLITIPTVAKIKYKNGVAVVKFDELYNLYGERNVIKKSKPTMHRAEAEKYGHELLSRALRDYGIEIEFEMLLTGEVYPGRWIKVENPKLGTKNILWVDSVSININHDAAYSMTVTCLYMPKEAKTEENSSSAVSGDSMDSIGHAAEKFGYCHACQTAECMEKTGCGDCWAMSDWLYKKLIASGIKARIVQYPTNSSPRHRSVLINKGNGWEDFPYRTYSGINRMFRNTSGSKSGSVLK